jgi:CubicO group peptidase (beta-lactamase class C family)
MAITEVVMSRFAIALLVLGMFSFVISAQDKSPEVEPAELGEGAKSLLERLDANDDGKLSESELPERARASFKNFDKDGDGFVAGDELNKAAEAVAAAQPREKGTKTRRDVAKLMKGPYKADEASGLFLQAARDYNAATNGEALLILKDGKVLLDCTDNGYDAKREHELASGTKSFSGIVAALMVEEGLLKWDELACDTLTEWKGDAREKITVRMLLSLCAGLPPEQDALQSPDTKDKYAYAIALKCKNEPGKKFEYGPAQYYCFGELVKRKLKDKKEDIKSYFMRKVGEPLGMKFTWRVDGAGNPHVPHGVYITAGEWAKFGEWVRNGGKHGEKQLLKQELLAECFKPSKANKNYGLTWWLGGGKDFEATGGEDDNDEAESTAAGVPKDLVYAAGKGKQHLFISREQGLTILRLANDVKSFEKGEFFSWLTRGKKAGK